MDSGAPKPVHNSADIVHGLNMQKHFDDAKELHNSFNLPVKHKPDLNDSHVNEMIFHLAHRAMSDLEDAIISRDSERTIDALARQLRVWKSTCIALGYDFELMVQALEVRHASDMSKLGPDGKPLGFDRDGKIIKGPNYKPPDYSQILKKISQNSDIKG